MHGEQREMGGAWLADRRKELGLTQRQVADVLGFAFPTTFAQIEHGKAPLSRRHYATMAHLLQVSLRDFVSHYDPEIYELFLAVEKE